jgi:hypothetical protein
MTAPLELERRSDPERKGVGVIIDLDKVEGILGFDDKPASDGA